MSDFKKGDVVVLKGDRPLVFGHGTIMDPVPDHLGEIGVHWDKVSVNGTVCGQLPEELELLVRA